MRPLLSALFLVFLLTVGYALFEAFGGQGFALRRAAGLPRRATAGRELALGVLLGWAIAIAVVLPMVLGRSLHVRFGTDGRAFVLAVTNAAALLVGALGVEMGLRGYPYRRLIATVGAAWATAVTAIAVGIWQWFSPAATTASVCVAMLFTVLLSLAWLRTHGLWLGWGLRAAWSVGVAVLFGLPLRGDSSFASVVQTRAFRPEWLTGAGYGPDGAVFAAVALLAGIVVLVQATDDYAWAYTRSQIVAGGYAVEPDPPAAHIAMEHETASRAPALVQILPSTPQAQSIKVP